MALVKRVGGFLHKRELKKFVGAQGYELDWNDKEAVEKLDREINKVIEIGAKAIEALAKRMVPVDSGSLRDTIKAHPSKYEKTGILNRRAFVEWVVAAGNETDVDYAGHVELGRYFKDSNARVPAVPFIRRPAAIMKKKLRRLLINRLRRVLDCKTCLQPYTPSFRR